MEGVGSKKKSWGGVWEDRRGKEMKGMLGNRILVWK